MSNCLLFRNETVVRPLFKVWPEDDPGTQFRYCCEFASTSTLQLSNYTNGPGGKRLQPAPYYDLGIVEKQNHNTYLWVPYWDLWKLPKQSSPPQLYCDTTDLQRLYLHRITHKVLVRGVVSWMFLLPLVPWTLCLWLLGRKYNRGIYRPRDHVLETDLDESSFNDQACKYWENFLYAGRDIIHALIAPLELLCRCIFQNSGDQQPDEIGTHPEDKVSLESIKRQLDEMKVFIVGPRSKVREKNSQDKEEVFADACLAVILLLAMVGSSLTEGIAHSSRQSWRAQIMFNAASFYGFEALIATISTFIRHCLFLELRHNPDWRWMKVFGQISALFMVCMYLGLVEDVTEHSLDSFAGPVLATCVAASVWSAGVEMVVIVRCLA